MQTINKFDEESLYCVCVCEGMREGWKLEVKQNYLQMPECSKTCENGEKSKDYNTILQIY